MSTKPAQKTNNSPRNTGKGLYTAERVERILKALRANNTRKAAYTYGGISHETFRTWMTEKPEFASAVLQAEIECEISSVAIIQKARPSSWQAAAWLLERKNPNDWKSRSGVTHDFNDVPDDELKQRAAAIAGRLGRVTGFGSGNDETGDDY